MKIHAYAVIPFWKIKLYVYCKPMLVLKCKVKQREGYPTMASGYFGGGKERLGPREGDCGPEKGPC